MNIETCNNYKLGICKDCTVFTQSEETKLRLGCLRPKSKKREKGERLLSNVKLSLSKKELEYVQLQCKVKRVSISGYFRELLFRDNEEFRTLNNERTST